MRRFAPTLVALALLAVLATPAIAGAKSTVYFTASARTPHVAQLWSVPATGGEPHLLRRRMPVGPQGGVAALARDGRRIFCICRKDEVDSIGAEGRRFRRVGSLPRAIRYSIVNLGPEGRAYWVRGYRRIVSQLPGAAKPRAFRGARAPDAVVDEVVAPSPDGRRVAYVAYGCLVPTCTDDDTETLLTSKADGSDRVVVYQSTGLGKEIWEVGWSADGRQLIFSDGTGEGDPKGELPVFFPRQLLVAPADGSNPAGTVVALPEEPFNVFFSPNAERLVFTAYARAGFELRTATADGTPEGLLTKTTCRSLACEFPPRVFAWR